MIDASKSDKFSISLSTVFIIIGIIAGTVGVGLFSLSGYFVKERIKPEKEKQSLSELLSSVVHNKPLLLVLSSNLISSFSGIGEAFSTYYYLDVLGCASLSIIAATPAFIISMISYSLIGIAKKRFNNKMILISAILLAALNQLILFFIGLNNFANIKIMMPAIIISNCVTGMCGGILNVLPTELLTEASDYSEWKTGVRTEGIAFSLKNSVIKVYGTLAQGFSAFLLSIIGYVSSSGGEIITQSDEVQKKIWIIYSLIPAIIRFLSAVPIFFYGIIGDERQKMFNELKNRRESTANKINKTN